MSKVSFDTVNRIINITIAPVLENGDFVVDIDVQEDLYSDGKNQWIASETLRKLKFPITTTGGDPLPGSKQLGDTYFLASDWKIAPYEASHRLRVNGNFYSVDGTSPFNNTIGNFNLFLEQTVSSLVDSTIQQLSELQYSAYNNGVTIDEGNVSGNAITGIDYPAGTVAFPSLLRDDALTIANNLGLNKAYIIGDITMNAGGVWTGFEFSGDSPTKTTMVIDPSAQVVDCEFFHATISGTLDGNSHIEDCVITGLDFVDGYIYKCSIGPQIIKLGTSTIANLFSCYSTVPGLATPVIDMNGTGILALRDYNGGIKLTNYTGSGSHSIDLSSGQVILDSTTVTSGTFVVRGVGKLIDENGNRIPTGVWNGGVTVVNQTSDATALLVEELHRIQGLDKANPMTVTPDLRSAGDIDLDLTGDGETIKVVTRQ